MSSTASSNPAHQTPTELSGTHFDLTMPVRRGSLPGVRETA